MEEKSLICPICNNKTLYNFSEKVLNTGFSINTEFKYGYEIFCYCYTCNSRVDFKSDNSILVDLDKKINFKEDVSEKEKQERKKAFSSYSEEQRSLHKFQYIKNLKFSEEMAKNALLYLYNSKCDNIFECSSDCHFLKNNTCTLNKENAYLFLLHYLNNLLE